MSISIITAVTDVRIPITCGAEGAHSEGPSECVTFMLFSFSIREQSMGVLTIIFLPYNLNKHDIKLGSGHQQRLHMWSGITVIDIKKAFDMIDHTILIRKLAITNLNYNQVILIKILSVNQKACSLIK